MHVSLFFSLSSSFFPASLTSFCSMCDSLFLLSQILLSGRRHEVPNCIFFLPHRRSWKCAEQCILCTFPVFRFQKWEIRWKMTKIASWERISERQEQTSHYTKTQLKNDYFPWKLSKEKKRDIFCRTHVIQWERRAWVTRSSSTTWRQSSQELKLMWQLFRKPTRPWALLLGWSQTVMARSVFLGCVCAFFFQC